MKMGIQTALVKLDPWGSVCVYSMEDLDSAANVHKANTLQINPSINNL